MFYFDIIQNGSENKKILKSSIFKEFEGKFKHLFTTKESFIKTKEPNLINTANSNKKAILDYFKIKNEDLFEIKQTHTTNIEICAKTPDLKGETDGVILQNSGSATILNFADCTPIILYDPENNIAAGIHAGWRGTAGEICKSCIKLMKEKFNSKPEKIMAAIGPCIAQEDFETGKEVYEMLRKTVKNSNGSELFKFKGEKAYPDLAKINARQLEEEGVKTIDICTFKTTSNNEFFFSYRKENKTTNRISMVIKLV